MCGIAGAVGYLDARVQSGVRRISEAQARRGPDASGEWASFKVQGDPGSGAMFAHRRLKIIDLSDDANQPFVDVPSQTALVFNGEIYNFRELRQQLEAAGHVFRTRSDTEVLLHSYLEWGGECVRRLRGMFAFAIWDGSKKQAFLARDRVGIKPLYYIAAKDDSGRRTLIFGSQVRAILSSQLQSWRLDPVGLDTYLWNGFVVGPGTLVQGIKQLPPGHSMTVGADGVPMLSRYWNIPRSSTDGNPMSVRHALEESIAQHMISDVPIGVFLSGGKDSSAVATMASRISDIPIKTFTITFEEAEFNEAAYAKRVADCIGSDHHEVLLTESIFRERLEAALESIDQPTFDGINSYLVSRAVKESGLTVALAGTGGDELFGGYRSFRDLPWTKQWASRLGFLPGSIVRPFAKGLSRAITGSLGALPPQTRWGRMADALETRGDMVRLYQVAYSLFTTDFYHELQDRTGSSAVSYGVPEERLRQFDEMTMGEPDLHAISKLEMSMFLGERLLRDTDAASMEVSLEVRVPLIDHHVIDSVFALSPERRFEPVREKPLLREMAMWDLPDYVFDRPKLGFELPLDTWCRKGLKEQVGSVLLDDSLCRSAGVSPSAIAKLWRAYQSNAPGLHWTRVWGLYVLLWWCHRHGVAAA